LVLLLITVIYSHGIPTGGSGSSNIESFPGGITGSEFSDCKYIENPTAQSFYTLWANKTSTDWTLTEIFAESDQTVTFKLQVDDDSPADVDSVSLEPVAGEAEDTSLNGDTVLGANEELDLVISSVDNTPTWVGICITYTN
jgi:hypothetical protein